jgi:uncharacterized protein
MYVRRELTDRFQKIASAYNVVALVGPRQSGKTTFLREQMKGMNASYVVFDDPDARGLFEEDVKKFEMQYVEGYEVTVLDEAQYCKDAGSKIKYLADKGAKIWMTSSSETLLGKEVLSYLVGRVSILRLYPFSLPEYLDAVGQRQVTEEILQRRIWEHATYGGYPKAVLAQDADLKKTIMSDLYETMILKDVARTFSIGDSRSLEELARYLASNTGALLAYDKIASDLKLSFQTVKKYLDGLEKSYLITRVLPYHTNKAKEITKQPKLYFTDTGMRNAIAKDHPAELDGKIFENYVLCELQKAGYIPKYWRTKTKSEVDYVIEKESKAIPVEVKLKAETGKIERSLQSYIKAYKPERALIVTYAGEKGETEKYGCRITYTDVREMRDVIAKI